MALARSLAARRPYYGWYIVVLCFGTGLMSAGVGTFLQAVFLRPMSESLGWSRAQFTLALTIGQVITAVLSIFMGPIIDRQGVRRLVLAGASFAGLGAIAISQVNALWQFYLLKGVVLSVGLMAANLVALNIVVANWFVRRRGRALALSGLGAPMSGVVLVPLVAWLIAGIGWRPTWAILGLLVWVVVILPMALFMERRPEDIGLRPDGDAGPVADRGPAVLRERPWTRREAIRTRTFWFLAIAFAFSGMTQVTWTIHIVAYFQDLGFPPTRAAAMLSMVTIGSISAKLPWGLLAERVAPKLCAAVAFLIVALSVGLLFQGFTSASVLYLLAVTLGVGSGALVLLQDLLWAGYFGRPSLGRVRTLALPITTLASASGPLTAAFIFDVMGSYRVFFTVLAAAVALSTVLVLATGQPRHPKERALA